MPFTPFHLGPGLFFGTVLFGLLHFPAFLAANLLPDIEPLLIILTNTPQPLHGFFHTFLGATLLGIGFGLLMVRLDPWIQKILQPISLNQSFPRFQIIASAVIGTNLHVLFDAPLYSDITPFFPLVENFLFETVSSSNAYTLCVVLGLIGIVLGTNRLLKTH
ncbi:MAG: hydrolase [Candidatus Diapherotrites archaeon]|uniref:Hydrolase n=1 Tax=Candidatus Iainarchaeum sp. TaxID=3101447 RepID=A0A8T4LD32_9ARCH|nr:hydrolase [Candidatus Diapherotrites archaeon]